MRAKYLNEFKQNQDPYKILNIGGLHNLKEGDIIKTKAVIWGHYPDGNMSVNGKDGQWTTTQNRDDYPNINQPYHIVAEVGELLVRMKESFTDMGWDSVRQDYRYGFYDWVINHPEFFEIYKINNYEKEII